jgi:hypothetical protein
MVIAASRITYKDKPMKIRDILTEARRGSFPFNITYTIAYTDQEGADVEVPVTIEGTVNSDPDMYATGDSPTGYEVTVDTVVNTQTGEPVDPSGISKRDQDAIERLAIGEMG